MAIIYSIDNPALISYYASKYLHAGKNMKDTQIAIMNAAKELFSKKGYAAVRTKEIAIVAGVNEATLFRHFKCKKELFESIIFKEIVMFDYEYLFHDSLTGDITSDLIMIATQVFWVYKENAQILMMIIKGIMDDNDAMAEYAEQCKGSHIKKYLENYFEDLKSRKIIDDEPVLLAELFMCCINGYLLSAFILEDRQADLNHLKQMIIKMVDSIHVIEKEGNNG